jgi:hypothetical protein
VGEPAREERVVLQGGDPPSPKAVAEASGDGGSWFFSISEAGEDDVQEPVGEGFGSPDRREPRSRVGREPPVILLWPEALDEPVGQLHRVLDGQVHALAARRGDQVGGVAC